MFSTEHVRTLYRPLAPIKVPDTFVFPLDGTLPGRDENISKQRWTDNVAQVLKSYVESQPNLANEKKERALTAADTIARIYVDNAQKYAVANFALQGNTDTMFGFGGGWAGWSGNMVDGERKCSWWTQSMGGVLQSSGVGGSGWTLETHFFVPMAGDGSLGVLFDHSFISVSFDPDHTGKDPDFILDPWPRARPDIFLFSDFKSLWPIEDAQVEHVLIR